MRLQCKVLLVPYSTGSQAQRMTACRRISSLIANLRRGACGLHRAIALHVFLMQQMQEMQPSSTLSQ